MRRFLNCRCGRLRRNRSKEESSDQLCFRARRACGPRTGEADVAVLIRDSTNKEIAERLVLSERTIDNHVQNIMNKLNLHHRAQIASWVTERNTPKGPIVADVETSLPRRPPKP